ncbi:MAG: hypothetical protein N2112_16635 [Gemmataceae bacterium]|nr:hypothetical protein [Gemmataceae bacterium]
MQKRSEVVIIRPFVPNTLSASSRDEFLTGLPKLRITHNLLMGVRLEVGVS